MIQTNPEALARLIEISGEARQICADHSWPHIHLWVAPREEETMIHGSVLCDVKDEDHVALLQAGGEVGYALATAANTATAARVRWEETVGGVQEDPSIPEGGAK